MFHAKQREEDGSGGAGQVGTNSSPVHNWVVTSTPSVPIRASAIRPKPRLAPAIAAR